MKIFITGGASGLGAAITEKLAAIPGNQVCFTYCHSEAKAKELEQKYPGSQALFCDFTNTEQVEELAKKLADISPDVLINNAISGKIPAEHFHKIPGDAFAERFRNNTLPVLLLTQAAISIFRKKKAGKIITILSSYIVNKPPIGLSEYVAAKNYLLSMSKSWAVENARYNITSNTVSPSFMLTGLNADVDERVVEEMVNNQPTKQLLSPEEVADTIAFLVSASNKINGINFLMNSAENVI